MRIRTGLPTFLLAVFALTSATSASIVTVDVTIKVVNPQARGITVVYKTELGEKAIELDVSRKAEITLNGKDATLDSLGAGLKAKVSYDKDLAIVTKIEAKGTATATKAPELVEVSELEGHFPWLSPDGMTVYWERKDTEIWTASRKDAQSYFENAKALFKGKCPTVSPDGLEMIVLGDRSLGDGEGSLQVSTRETVDKPWRRAVEIPELRNARFPCWPSLSPDDLTLYFYSMFFDFKTKEGKKYWWQGEIMYTTRRDKNSPWVAPKPLPIKSQAKGFITWPFVIADGLVMFCVRFEDEQGKLYGHLLEASRASLDKPFARFEQIQPVGLPELSVTCPRFVAATNELFFSRRPLPQEQTKTGGIWVIRNFVPPIDVKGSRGSKD